MPRIYTDGSYAMGVGGWAWWNELTGKSESGVEVPSTNQRMELYAALDAIDDHLDEEEITIVSDSAYLTNCFKVGWHKTWTVNGWRNSRGKPVENSDIWKPLVNLVAEHGNVTFEWVKGHSGDYGNDMADKLATEVVAMTVGDGR